MPTMPERKNHQKRQTPPPRWQSHPELLMQNVGLGKNKTPSMAIGLYHRPISMLELLSLRGFHFLTI